MGDRDDRDGLTRRDFLRRAGVGVAAATGAAAGLGQGLPAAFAALAASIGMKHRILGKTRLKVSELSFGTIRTGDAGVIHRGLDLGINYIDTAPGYRHGRCESDLGVALKDRRDKVVLATKWETDGSVPASDLLRSLDTSLQRLQTDRVDLIQIHGADSEAQVNSDQVWEAFRAAKKAGKARFNGLSTHRNQAAVIRAAIASKRYDAVLVAYNAANGQTVAGAVAEAKRAGVGVIAMKSLQPVHHGGDSEAFQSLKGSPHQQAIQWVLRDQNVSTVIVDMPSYEELEHDVAAATGRVTAAALQEFEAAVAVGAAGACRLCGACSGQCPAGVQVADIMRFLLYHDGYGDRERAIELYRGLPASRQARPCGDCTNCRVICPWGLPLKARMRQAHAVLA
jgi:aryl-alcohol dehydrogenase-like predicted oxidoreductase